jgi:hypothetical protein
MLSILSQSAPHTDGGLGAAAGPLGLTVTQWILLGSGAAFIFAVNRWRRNTVQKKYAPATPPAAARPDPNALNVREVAAELQALLADLEETSRRLTAQLDNRYTRLEQLLADADAKIRQLESLAAATPASAPTAPHDDFSPHAFPTAHTNGHAPSPCAEAPRDAAERTLQRLRQERGAPAPAEDPAYRPIYDLADRGKSSREIAQELGRQPGEIDLILALRAR